MKQESLRETIDRMVEDAIRRVLPGVMNEVLLRTIANSGAISEQRAPVRAPSRAPVRQQAPQRRAPQPPPAKKNGKLDLNEFLDRSAGSEFYDDPRHRREEPEEEYEEEVQEEAPRPIESRIQALPPELRGLAEGMLDDDDGEMWDDNEQAPMLEQVDPAPIRDVHGAAKKVGIDFSRMKNVIKATGPATKDRRELAQDARAKAQFEQTRIDRMRERLGGVKPVE